MKTLQREGLSVDFCGEMKMKKRERRREKWNERRARLSRPSKTPEGSEEKLLE